MATRFLHELLWPPLGLAGLALARYGALDQLGLLCPFHTLTGLPCVACGGTRAAMAFARGQWALAFALNPLVTLGAWAFLAYCVYALFALISRRPYRPRWTGTPATLLRVGVVAAVSLNWAYLIAVGR